MIFEEVKDILAENLDLDPNTIELTSDLATDLGADSLYAIDIVMSIEDQYGLEVPDSVIEGMKTVEYIVTFIESNYTESWYSYKYRLIYKICREGNFALFSFCRTLQINTKIFVILGRWQ